MVDKVGVAMECRFRAATGDAGLIGTRLIDALTHEGRRLTSRSTTQISG
jgi:hypothetical protein